jgi:hypothetical protein
MMVKTPPKSWPVAQRIVEVTSGDTGYVTSTTYSNATGNSANEEAPRTARIIYGATIWWVVGAKRKARYDTATMGVRILMVRGKACVLSVIIEMMIEATIPTTIKRAPAIPLKVSDKDRMVHSLTYQIESLRSHKA